MSPEQVSGALARSAQRRVLARLLAASSSWPTPSAYAGSTHEIITRIAEGPVPRLLDVVPEVDPRLDEIVSHAMALDPADRFEDLDDLRSELARLRRDMDPETGVHLRSQVVVPERAGTSSSRIEIEEPRGAAAARTRWPGSAPCLCVAIGLGALWAAGISTGVDAPNVANAPAPAAPVVQSVLPSRPGASNGADEVWRRLAIGDRPAVLRLLRRGGDRRRTGSGPSTRLRGDRRSARDGASGARRGRRHTGHASLGGVSPGRRPARAGQSPPGGPAASQTRSVRCGRPRTSTPA